MFDSFDELPARGLHAKTDISNVQNELRTYCTLATRMARREWGVNEILLSGQSGLRAWSKWLQSVGIDPVTGWRWRQRGWIIPTNIAGRLYVSAEAIAEFERRAGAGEFAKTLANPKMKVK
jgi:hypothetical protein